MGCRRLGEAGALPFFPCCYLTLLGCGKAAAAVEDALTPCSQIGAQCLHFPQLLGLCSPSTLECEVSPSAPAAVPAAAGKAKTTLGQILTWNSHFFSHFSLQVLPSEHFLVVCFGSVICFQVLQDAQLIWKECFPHTCKIFQWDSENPFVFVII